MERICRIRSDGVEGQDEKDDDERVHPCMTEGEFFPPAVPAADSSPPPAGATTGFLRFFLRLDVLDRFSQLMAQQRARCPTGDAGGDWTVGKVGVGSRVERAEAPLSPLRPSPTALEARRGRGRGMLSESAVDLEGWSIEAILGKDSMAAEVF